MALKSIIYKAELQIADMDRHYYQTHTLTLARHPSETEERLMIRLLAFALQAHEALSFGKGLSADDEPDLWHKDLTGAIELWIEVGQPEERRLLQASARAGKVSVYAASPNISKWWAGIGPKVSRLNNLVAWHLSVAPNTPLSVLTNRTMNLDVTIQDGNVWVGDGTHSVEVSLQRLN